MCRKFFLFKKTLLLITFYSISFIIFSDRLDAEHYDTPGEGNYYSEFWDTWGEDNYNERFDNKGDESLEFGPLAIKKGPFYECKDGRSIKESGALPISPSKFFQSHAGSNDSKDDIDIREVESVLLFTKNRAPRTGSLTAKSIIGIALKREIDLNEKESAYFLDQEKTPSDWLNYHNGGAYTENRTLVYSNKINSSNKLVKIRFKKYGSEYFTDSKGKEYRIESIQKSFRLYCPEGTDQILYRGAELFRFGYLVNKYGERLDYDLPAILITSKLYLDSENHPDQEKPSF